MTGALGALTLLLLATPAQSQEIFASGEVFRDLVVSYPYVLWMQEAATCPGGELAPPCRIRGRTEGGFFPSTLYEASVVNNSIDSFNFELQASSGLIYFLGNNNVLRRPMFSAPSDSVTVVASKASTASGEIALTDTHVWWSENEILYRAPIDGGARQQMYDAPFGTIRELRADAQGGIWFIADAFLSPDTLTRYTSSGGAVFGPAFTNAYALDSTHVYIAVGDGSSERRLRRASLGNLPGHASGAVLHLAGDSSDPEVTTMAIAADDYLYYFKDVAVASQEVIYRLNKFQWASGTPEGVTLQVGSVSDMNVSDNYLYWRQGISNVTRLELSGIVPVQADASLTGMEVTQGVQTLNNTVSLVENKPTVVRVYPQVAGISGVTSVNVTVQLTGTRDGVALTFPPPPQSRRLQNMIADRRDTATSFDFILPYNWRSGTIDLTATISISGIADTNLSNNTVSESGLVFEPKAPICVKYLPVLNTDSLVYRVRNLATGEYNPHWLATYDRTLSVWPSPTIRFYTQTTSLRKPQFLGPAQPFNLNNDADVDHVLAALWEHNVWDDAPGWCSADNARTHYYAMVPDGMVNASVLGKARLGEPLLMVRQVSGGQATFEDPWAGTISAHELRHTYNDLFGTNENYQHVMCDLPAGADFNSFYPYDPNSIGMSGGVLNGAAGWGYDTITNTVIPPDLAWDNGNLAADYMSYCEPGWTSDYSWNLMVDKFPDRAGGKNLEKANRATDVIMVSGRIFADESGGEFFSVFYVPPGLDVEPTASAGT
ncbi:MAG: hypothetical protein KJO55_01600, partial [Gammaproteobacteria bacterium]|nr:hypothetical protein [Gammaproteobacteria bacterium]